MEIDGKLLVDGGLVRNFPVQEVIDMGADIVIGVFVSSDLKSKDDLKDFVSILFQSSWVLSAYDTREQTKMVDYYIEPELSDFSTGSFNLCGGLPLENPDTSDLLGDTTYRLGLGVSVGYFSIIGPLSVALSWDKKIVSKLNIGFYF